MQPLKARGDVVLEPYLDNDVMMTSYTTAIMRGGQAVGVVGVDVSLAALDKQAKGVKVLDSGYAYVAAPTGTLLAYPPNRKLAGTKKCSPRPPRWRASPAGSRRATTSCSTRRFKTTGWTFVAVAPKDEILAPVAALRTKLILFGLLALLVVGGVLVFVAARIARPVREVAEAAERIGDGDLE